MARTGLNSAMADRCCFGFPGCPGTEGATWDSARVAPSVSQPMDLTDLQSADSTTFTAALVFVRLGW